VRAELRRREEEQRTLSKKPRKANSYMDTTSLDRLKNMESRLNENDGELQLLRADVRKLTEEIQAQREGSLQRSWYTSTSDADTEINH
jgi:phosphomevalonate kinase